MKSQTVNRAFDEELEHYDLYPMLNKVSCKTLILHGRYDTIPLAVPQTYKKLIMNLKLVVFKKSGHFPFIEENKKVITLLKEFLLSK